MSKTIEGVPESFTREEYLSLFRAVGLDPNHVVSLTLRSNGAYAEVFARFPDGSQQIDAADGLRCKHRVFIPVDEEPSASQAELVARLCDATKVTR